MPRKRWKDYSNTCLRCKGNGFIFSPAKGEKITCPDCEGTGYGPAKPPKGSNNYVVTSR